MKLFLIQVSLLLQLKLSRCSPGIYTLHIHYMDKKIGTTYHYTNSDFNGTTANQNLVIVTMEKLLVDTHVLLAVYCCCHSFFHQYIVLIHLDTCSSTNISLLAFHTWILCLSPQSVYHRKYWKSSGTYKFWSFTTFCISPPMIVK